MSQQRAIYFGPPGTGKTTKLIALVREELQRGLDPRQIAFVAFTRKAVAEARERAAGDLGLGEEDLPWWRTLHSMAAKQLGAREGDFLTKGHWLELGDRLGYDLRPPEEDEEPAATADRGGRLQFLMGLAQATRRPLTEIWRDRADGEVSWLELERFHRTVTEFKEGKNLLDYSDLLDEATTAPPLDVKLAIVDEAQDLTTQQWDYVDAALARADRAYLAGDDDQAIYAWSGADVRRFLAQPGERRVLGRSYRLPATLWTLAERLSARLREREPKAWGPDRPGGDVVPLAYPEDAPIEDGATWLLLSRTGRGLAAWEGLCRARGVPYAIRGRPAVKPQEALAIRAWETFRRGAPLAGVDLDLAAQFLARPLALDPERSYTVADFGREPGGVGPWREVLVKIPPWRRKFYEACLRRNPRALSEPARVTLSTIHGVKGGEADRVALLQDVTPRVDRALAQDPDAEHRVWYVAATRARGTLCVVRPRTERFYDVLA